MMKKSFKAWAVVWTKKGYKEYGCVGNGVITVEPAEDLKVSCTCKCHPKWHYITIHAFFTNKREAEKFRGGNLDWEVRRITITL